MNRALLITVLFCGLCVAGLAWFDQTTKNHLAHCHETQKQYQLITQLPENWCNTECIFTTLTTPNATNASQWQSVQHVTNPADGRTVLLHHAMATQGYGGDISLWVTTNQQGLVKQIRIGQHQETPGIGTRATSNLAWLNQCQTQLSAGLAPDAFSGATITSRAIIQTLNDIQQTQVTP